LRGIRAIRKTSKAGRPTSDELDRRKERIVDIATQLFTDQGYAATSLVDIAKRAGVATRTIYQHYGDKAVLFQEVIFNRNNAPDVPAPRASEDDSLNAALMRTAHYIIQVTFNEKTANLMRLMVAEQNRFPDLTKKVAQLSFERFNQSIAQVFSDLSLLGRIPKGNHLESGVFFTDIILGAAPLYNYTHWQDRPPSEAQLQSKVDLFIQGRFGEKIGKTARSASRLRPQFLRSAQAETEVTAKA
jgi:TetR/AcrR family transcriptional regulator, mexJK operon transcriptional repressor